MVESFIVMLVLCFFLFALIQVAHLYVVKMVTDYTSYSVARSSSVGFNKRLLERSGRVAAIGVSGNLKEPRTNNFQGGDFVMQYGAETRMIPRYISGALWFLDYQHSDKLSVGEQTNGDRTQVRTQFTDYPIDIPFINLFYDKKAIDISSDAELVDHSYYYLK